MRCPVLQCARSKCYGINDIQIISGFQSACKVVQGEIMKHQRFKYQANLRLRNSLPWRWVVISACIGYMYGAHTAHGQTSLYPTQEQRPIQERQDAQPKRLLAPRQLPPSGPKEVSQRPFKIPATESPCFATSPFTPRDPFPIGSSYSVSGFDGELSLVGAHGRA